VLVNEQDTSDQDRNEWSVRCDAVLDPSLWISGVLNDVFDFAFLAYWGYQFIHSCHVFFSTRMRRRKMYQKIRFGNVLILIIVIFENLHFRR